MARRTVVGKPTNFGEWLLQSLQQNKLSQKQLAFEIAVAENTVGAWIRNQRKVGITNLVWICIFLEKRSNKTYDELIVESSLFFK